MKKIKLLIALLFITSISFAQTTNLGGDYFTKSYFQRSTATRIAMLNSLDSLVSLKLITPSLGVASGTSLALGGATLGSNALAVTGTSLLSGGVIVGTTTGLTNNTADGSDNSYLVLSGGGGFGPLDRGAYIYLSGNERTSFRGQLEFGSGTGDGVSNTVLMKVGGNQAILLDVNADITMGTVQYNATGFSRHLYAGSGQFGNRMTTGMPLTITNFAGTTKASIDSNGVGTFIGNVNIGATTAVDTQSPDLVITGDADSDGTAFTTEAITLSLTSNATPTLATWGFTSTQGAGYTFDKAVTVAGAITGSGNFALTDPGTSANSYSISLKADNATTVQEGLIQVMYGANPYMRFSPPNAAGVATAFIDLKSNQMIFPDSTSLTTNTGANDVMLFKAVDNDDGLLYTIAALTGGITPTFDLLAGRLTGTLSGNSQNITGVGQLAATTYGSDGSVSNAELLFINTLSSNAQTQIDTKAPSTSPTFATSITGSYLTASEMLITDGSKNIVSAPVATYPSLTELTYVKGVTSAIQTQLNLKAPLASPTFTGTVTIPTPFTLGAISVTATGTELNYVAGVTSSIQTQLNSKAPTANPTFTGTMKRSVTATITASTTQTQGQGALTTDVNEVSVVANVNDVVTLPSAVAGMEIFIINNGANTLQIFPASGDNLGAGLNASTTLASGSNVTFASYNDTNWEIK